LFYKLLTSAYIKLYDKQSPHAEEMLGPRHSPLKLQTIEPIIMKQQLVDDFSENTNPLSRNSLYRGITIRRVTLLIHVTINTT